MLTCFQELPDGMERTSAQKYMQRLADSTEKANELMEQFKAVAKVRGL